jgi:hypothetical protein
LGLHATILGHCPSGFDIYFEATSELLVLTDELHGSTNQEVKVKGAPHTKATDDPLSKYVFFPIIPYRLYRRGGLGSHGKMGCTHL